MRCALLFAGALLLAACAAPRAVAPAPGPVPAGEPGLTVRGLPQGGRLSLADLEALGGTDVPFVFRDQPHVYRAVPLHAVLARFGFDAGPGGQALPVRERRPGWRQLVIASAADGFWSVFTCAEVMPEMGATRAFVAWARDGQPLPADEGPLRLVVTTDRKGSRSARQLVGIDVVSAPPPPAP